CRELRCRDADLLLEIPPHGLCPPIGTGDPRRGTSIDTTVECLIALAQLLPFKPAEATLGLHRDELLADELLDPFGLGAARQMHVAWREFRTRLELLVGRRRQAQVAIGLALEGCDRNRPQPRAAARLLATVGHVHMRRARHRCGPVKALDALHRSDLRVPGPARPGIYGRRLIAGIDCELGKFKLGAVSVRPSALVRTTL